MMVSVVLASGAGAQEATDVSPFEYVRWKDVTPEVKVGGVWYELLSINDLPLADVFDHCRRLHLGRWRQFFDEHLVDVLAEMDQPAGPTVALGVRDLKTGETRRLMGVAMTAENHAAILDARHGDRDESLWIVGTPGIQREHRDTPHPMFTGLARRIESSRSWAVERITAKQAAEDLDDLEWHLVHRYAYLNRNRVDYQAALDTIRLALGDGISRGAFAVQLVRFLALFGDGNTRLNRWSDINTHRTVPWIAFLPPGYTPFRVADAGGRMLAYSDPHHRFLDERYPYLKSLDGVPIDQWVAAASGLVARVSPRFIRRMAATDAMLVGYVRGELGLPDEKSLWIELESADHAETRRFSMPVAKTPPTALQNTPIEFKKLHGNVGYLRITTMQKDPRQMAKLFEAMDALRSTRGLILDLRDNKGGTREPLRALFPFFMARDEDPLVISVAATRVPPGKDPRRPEGDLGDIFMYPQSSQFWNARERAAIERCSATFKPEWQLPATGFSQWHYFVVSPRKSAAYYHYGRSVVVLMNGACFSTTEVLLGAFKGRRGVTLMGEASGGGCGRATNIAFLANSGFRVQLSSMAAFRADGALYDGRGIEPDVVARPTPTDLIGKTDSVLEAALKRFTPAP